MQAYIQSKELVKDYFVKLSEEVGELAGAVHKGAPKTTEERLKGHDCRGNLGCALLCSCHNQLL